MKKESKIDKKDEIVIINNLLMLIKYQEKQLVPFEFKWVNDSNYIDCSELVA